MLFAIVPLSTLGVGPEISNNMEAPHNCVGGSEVSCIPANPPVGNPAYTGMGVTVPAPAYWYKSQAAFL
eukprot:CAMPEP_0181323128 /NCGR_PEP_ID=MMETSP1101-20121128/19609_1 /TAXON_ID=46948 /ORGANISM="Rhodomonas abbreviata, Strain Caron Lab Isolate" /LENGTH=68 /DNA_ID=CAMNT_0023431113 /DNA_START=28 /DNA_END=234 /DNA_ORIENTATION=+